MKTGLAGAMFCVGFCLGLIVQECSYIRGARSDVWALGFFVGFFVICVIWSRVEYNKENDR
jgi:hypothetical protein